MLQFVYTAKDVTGRLVKAEVEAANQKDAAKLLVSKKLFPLTIVERKEGLLHGNFEQLARITAKDRVLFTRQLSTLVKAGLPLAKALQILTQQTKNPKMLRLIHDVSNSIEGGSSLSDSLGRHPDVFSVLYLSLVEAGEVSGELDDTLFRLAAQEEKTANINSKIRGALTYPAVVLLVLVAVMVLMVTVVLPQVGKMYADLGKPLPGLAGALLAFSHWAGQFWYIFLLLIVGAGYAARAYRATRDGRKKLDQLKLQLPFFKALIIKMYMARFARTLGSLVGSGVPVLQALQVTGKAIGNVMLEAETKVVATKVKAGVAMSQPLGESQLFLPLVAQMIGVGEQTGTLGESLEKVAEYYEDEVDETVSNISTLIEPATMVLLGGMVAFLIAAVLMPIYGLVSSIH